MVDGDDVKLAHKSMSHSSAPPQPEPKAPITFGAQPITENTFAPMEYLYVVLGFVLARF